LKTWQKINARRREGGLGGEYAVEAQAREQYFIFRSTGEQELTDLYTAEGRLRYLLGLAATDGRLIRPSDEPNTAKVTFDWKETVAEALRRSIEIRRQKSNIKHRELELAAFKTAIKDDATSEDKQQYIGKRNVRLTNARLNLSRERAILTEMELELTHKLRNATHNLENDYALAETNFNRRVAAEANLDAVKTAYENGTVQIGVLLQAQRLRAQAGSDYYRATVNYVKSVALVHYRKGSLLESEGVSLVEETQQKE
jgi:outer membrane protein TolC